MKTILKRAVVLIMAASLLVPAGCSRNPNKSDETHQEKEVIAPVSSSIELISGDSVGASGSSFSADTINKCDFDDKIVSYVEPSVYIYKIRDTQSEPVGILFPGNEATIEEVEGDWTYVSFRGTYGYVLNESVLFGMEANMVASQKGILKEVLRDANTNVYTESNIDSQVKAVLGKDTEFTIDAQENDFYLITYQDESGYIEISAVKETYELEEAMTVEEYNAMLQAIKEEEERQQAELERQQREAEIARQQREAAVQAGLDNYIPTVQGEAYNLSSDDLWLLACIVKYESGWQEYDGKLAVANVVLNRYKSGAGSIANVIYARNQFSGVSDGAGGPSEYFANNYLNVDLNYNLPQSHADECMKAAVEAASGINNIGYYKFFIGVAYAEYSRYSSYKIIGGHCFYNY